MAEKQAFDQLLECKFRGISFPIRAIATDVSQEQAMHKYPNRDGARVEGTGRNPIQVNGTAVLFNNISPASYESWTKGSLFPDVYTKLLVAFADGTSGEFQHPLLGKMTVKPVSFRDSVSGDKRHGTEVEFSLIETISDDEDIFTALSAKASASSDVAKGAAALDAALPSLQVPRLPKMNSFQDLARGVQGIIDKPTLLAQKARGTLDRIEHQCNQVIDACNRANNVVNGRAMVTAQRLKADVKSLRAQLQTVDRKIATLVARTDTSLTALTQDLGNNLDELIKLNPTLVSGAIVRRGALVRYYKD
jgi:prophage DNA circulation protein